MAQFFIGALFASAIFMLTGYIRRNSIRMNPLKWIFSAGFMLYTVFVAEVIASFLAEGTPKGAVVNGTILGFIAIIWGALLYRHVFSVK